MKYLIFSLALSLSLLGVGCGTYYNEKCPVDKSNCVRKEPDIMRGVVKPSVELQFEDGRCRGSGTVVTCRGKTFVITAGHVTDGLKHMLVVKEDESGFVKHSWTADVVAQEFDIDHDLGLLKVMNSEGLESADLYAVTINRGQDAWFIGSNGGLHSVLEKTIISRPIYWSLGGEWEDGPARRAKRTMFTGNAWYGNSGGGLFVLDGNRFVFVGVVVELARPGEKSPTLAITQEQIQLFLYNYAH